MLMQGALLALRDSTVELGRDISFVGCDDVVVAALHQPPIAVVARDMPAFGAAAADLLLRDLEGNGDVDADGEPGAQVTLPTEFIPRASAGPAPTD
jgi:DNA-binding LacI/PurR family transcriptional regulator